MPLLEDNASYREHFREVLLQHLYQPQETHWEKELQTLININTSCYGKLTNPFIGIHYLNKNWSVIAKLDLNFNITYLTLHPDFLPKEAELLEVVGQLSELEAEKYEVSRFLSGLVLFPAPVKVLQDVLGKQLSQEICSEFLTKQYLSKEVDLREYYEDLSSAWDDNAQTALMTYVDQHKYLLKLVNQRLLINLISQDQIKK